MVRKSLVGFVLVACMAGSFGCAATQPRPIQTDSALGRVVVYRNGVAYFERRALVDGDQLTLTVPVERVDDFLKSLTVVDAKTGKSLPVSFPTMDRDGDEAQMVIQLPTKGKHDLRISYVTESPAWKPSYRLLLDETGSAKLEAWAVVDNVSGEDWDKVSIGVGSTSALSFKYDLHSVRIVERETLSDGRALALAPPTGGSPYAIAGKELQVVGNIRLDAVDEIANEPRRETAHRIQEQTRTETRGKKARKRPRNRWSNKSGGADRTTSAPATGSAAGIGGLALQQIAGRIRGSGQKVRIEGFARPGDKDRRGASLKRANAIRDGLIANGVSADQVEAVGTGHVSTKDGVRVLAVQNKTPTFTQSAKQDPAAAKSDDPIGSAYFVAKRPMTIEKGHSAMVSMLATKAEARQVYYYDPISTRGSKRFAFKAVELHNPSKYTLDSGPFTVYAKSQFLGEGLSEPIPPKSKAFIPFALDRKMIIEPEVTTREEIDKLVTVERGIVNTEAQRIRRSELTLHNRGDSEALVYIRHAVPKGWKLRDDKTKFEKLRGAYLFPVKVPARGAKKLRIEEAMPIMKTVDIRTAPGIKDLALFLRTSSRLEPELKKKLAEIIEMHRDMADMQERIDVIHEQMNTYRTRVDEIHVQLVTLRKNQHAVKLRRHLAKKMEEISDRLQQSTMQVTDLEGKRMTHKVELQDRLAELTLRKRKEQREAVASTK